MNKKAYIVIALIIVIAFGAWFYSRDDAGTMRNGAMLQSGSDAQITTQDNVAYFEGTQGYFARPAEDGDYPGIVVIHENRGLRPEIRTMADELAKQGYMALAVDLLGEVVETQDEARALTANYDQAKGVENMQAAVNYLEDQGATKVASLGWCFGGAQSLQLALSGQPLDATVIYYGRLATTSEALSPIKWPVLGIFAGEDQSISVESVNQFDAALTSLEVPHEVHIYPGVRHAFANPSGMNYAPEETKDAWAKTLAFLNDTLK